MSATNIKTRRIVEMEILLEDWKNGQVDWNVNNQHDEYILESALSNIDNIGDDDILSLQNISTIAFAGNISQFQIEELSTGWTQ